MVQKFPQHTFSKAMESGVKEKRYKGSMQTHKIAGRHPIGFSFLKIGTAYKLSDEKKGNNFSKASQKNRFQ